MTTPDDKLPDVWVSRRGGEPVALLSELDEARARIVGLEAELAAERERREAAEGILRNIRNRGAGGWVASAIDVHFARYEKEPT